MADTGYNWDANWRVIAVFLQVAQLVQWGLVQWE